jgi:hypothetical protein
MVDRKQFPEVPAVDDALARLLETSRQTPVSENALGSEAKT